jgi:F0F1-type ATP synthase assembly protein I
MFRWSERRRRQPVQQLPARPERELQHVLIASGILRASDRCESNFAMAQLTSIGLIKVLGHVSAIMVIPILGGAVAGLVLDRILGTSPIYVLSGFAVGNLISITGIWLYIRAHRPVEDADGANEGSRTNERRDGA